MSRCSARLLLEIGRRGHGADSGGILGKQVALRNCSDFRRFEFATTILVVPVELAQLSRRVRNLRVVDQAAAGLRVRHVSSRGHHDPGWTHPLPYSPFASRARLPFPGARRAVPSALPCHRAPTCPCRPVTRRRSHPQAHRKETGSASRIPCLRPPQISRPLPCHGRPISDAACL